MAANNPYQAYQQGAVQTASPGELTLMLYNGCLKFIKLARTGIQEKNIELKNTNLLKAQNIIQELMITLDTNVQVAKSMMAMYDYINQRLIEANCAASPPASPWKRRSSINMINDLYQLTDEIYRLIQTFSDKNREEGIQKLEYLLLKRRNLIEKLPPKSRDNESMGKKIVEMNKEIDQKLILIRHQIMVDLRLLKAKKKHSNSYVNPYETKTFDGMFYDKKN